MKNNEKYINMKKYINKKNMKLQLFRSSQNTYGKITKLI